MALLLWILDQEVVGRGGHNEFIAMRSFEGNFARRIVVGGAFRQASLGTSGVLVKDWLKETFSDFRKDIYASYVVEAAFGGRTRSYAALHASVCGANRDVRCRCFPCGQAHST